VGARVRETAAPFFFVAAALMALAAAAGEDQSTSPPVGDPTFGTEVEVTVINVDVFVRDRKGRPVDGLTIEDFRVIQDGTNMPISNFAAHTFDAGDRRFLSPEVSEVSADDPEAPPPFVQPAYVVLHIDNENLLPLHRNRVLERVRTFVDETLAAPVRMMVASPRRSLRIEQPFTDDPDVVIAALQRVSTDSGGRIVRDRERHRIFAWMGESALNIGRPAFEMSFDIDRRNTMEQVQAQNNHQRMIMAQVRAQITVYAEGETGVQKNSLAAMHEVLRLVSGLQGRRSIIYVSNGLPMTPGLGLMHEFAAVFRDSSIFTRQAQWDLTPDLRALAAAANRQGVSLYTIDASGLNHLEGFGPDDNVAPQAATSWFSQQNLQNSLTYLADATGGLAVINTNDVSAGLRSIRDDIHHYYSIGYTISTGNGDTTHRIGVELPRHPDYDIRHRKWFNEKTLETRVQERVSSLLVRNVENNPLELKLRFSEPTPVARKQWEVPCRVSIPLRNLVLAREANDYVGHVELYLGARNVHGDESLPHRREFEVRVPAARYKPEQNQFYSIVMNLLLREQQHIVGVGIVDLATRHASFGRASVEVP